jgi:DNA-binding NarL/FixJ family response regulator
MPAELAGLRVLVVEDEFLVAIDLELMLRELGCEVVGPIGDLARAERAAAEEALDIALLDVNIGGQPVTTVADALVARGVPMVFCTGYQAENLPDRYPAAPTLMKPFQPLDIAAALKRAAGGEGPA